MHEPRIGDVYEIYAEIHDSPLSRQEIGTYLKLVDFDGPRLVVLEELNEAAGRGWVTISKRELQRRIDQGRLLLVHAGDFSQHDMQEIDRASERMVRYGDW